MQQENICTYSLVPPGVDLYHALQPLREELAKLHNEGLVVYDTLVEQSITVYPYIAHSTADSVQAAKNAGHGGSNCHKNCKICWVDIGDRMDVQLRTQRTTLETTTIKNIIRDLSGQRKAAASTASGLTDAQLPFDGLLFDPHAQQIPEPHHNIDLGLLSLLLRANYQHMTPEHREVYEKRIESFPYPHHTTKLPRNIMKGLKKKSSAARPSSKMATVVKFGLITVMIAGDISDSKVFDLVGRSYVNNFHSCLMSNLFLAGLSRLTSGSTRRTRQLRLRSKRIA